ncbi:DNA cytosine methyltransferase [Knoellia flava]|uniref:DNA cytosine methyltransferase n=1 Tax=Knoellia flava TaxID=913969 RepID=UPI000A06B30D|nr:DNA cytosine methyltransferase [Knoellia flava]
MSARTLIDLFAGAGGLSDGLQNAGFKALYANEFETTFASTYAFNHPDTVVESTDIRNVDARAVRIGLGLKQGDLTLLAGGPPCQGFSINAPARRESDKRNHLFRDYLRFVDEFQPLAVLIENVPGLVSFSGGATLEAILEALEQLGYASDVQILYAPHFGVPQTRWRTIVLGFRDGVDPTSAFPSPRHAAPARVNFTSRLGGRRLVRIPTDQNLRRHTTVRESLDDLPFPGTGEEPTEGQQYRTEAQNEYQARLRVGSSAIRNHVASRLSALQLERLRHIPPGGNWTNIPRELLPSGMQRARTSDHTKRYGRVHPDGLASTILTKCDPHWGAYYHYAQDRAFTVREAARLQSFRDSYLFLGNRADQYRQVGNAVPPLLAQAIGASIAARLDLADRASA